jgi:hypothetical protein
MGQVVAESFKSFQLARREARGPGPVFVKESRYRAEDPLAFFSSSSGHNGSFLEGILERAVQFGVALGHRGDAPRRVLGVRRTAVAVGGLLLVGWRFCISLCF